MFEKRTTIRNNFKQEKVDSKMRSVYNLGTGITGRTPIQKPKMGYTCCSILQRRNRILKLENHKLKAREKKAIQRCADLKEDNVHLNNLLKSTINSYSARIELAESNKDHHIKQLELYAYELVKKYNVLTVEYNDHALKSKKKIAELEAKCAQFCKNATENALDHKKKQKSKIKCEVCDEEFALKFKLNRHLVKFHNNVEKKNTKTDDKFPTILHNSEKTTKKEEIANLVQPKNPAATDSEPMLLNVGTLSLKTSKDQRCSEKNTKIYPQVEAEQPLEENKLEPCTSGLKNPNFFLQDEGEVAWAYRKLGLEQ